LIEYIGNAFLKLVVMDAFHLKNISRKMHIRFGYLFVDMNFTYINCGLVI